MTTSQPVWYRSRRFWDRFSAPFLAYEALLFWVKGDPVGAALWGGLSVVSFLCHWFYPLNRFAP